MTNHTEGLWLWSHRIGQDEKYRTQVFPSADPDNTIATLHWHSVPTESGFTTDREANAHLIAAAPDMLEALKWANRHISRPRRRTKHNVNYWDGWEGMTAAIKKAEGE